MYKGSEPNSLSSEQKQQFWKRLSFIQDFLPEFGVLCVHHCRTLSEDFCNANGTDLLLNCSWNLLNLWNNDFLQHHTKHSAIEKNIYVKDLFNFLQCIRVKHEDVDLQRHLDQEILTLREEGCVNVPQSAWLTRLCHNHPKSRVLWHSRPHSLASCSVFCFLNILTLPGCCQKSPEVQSLHIWHNISWQTPRNLWGTENKSKNSIRWL